MKSTIRFVLITLLACSLTSLAVAAETAPVAEPKAASPQLAAPAPTPEGKTPSLLPVIPLNLLAPAQKAPESQAAAKPIRLGYIDPIRVNNESNSGKASQKQLEEKKKKLQAQIESKRKQLDKMKSTIEATIQSLTPPQREAKGREFQKKVEEFQKFGQNSEKELQTMQQGLGNSLYEKIEQACTEYGKANGLALVVIKRELLYLDSGVETVDVTDGVVKLLNEKEPKK